MASDYEKICEENRSRYGSEGARKSGGLAASLYDDRAHFIYELLQNAEDAMAKRGEWKGKRAISFNLTREDLRVSHFGKPFDESDVKSICDIAESTKTESAIGRFGLGFKSVYAITNLPEIHSGDEDFAIDDFVFPKAVDRTPRDPDETQIILPLNTGNPKISDSIISGLQRLTSSSLLFLRNIEEISWSVDGSVSGIYMRTPPEELGSTIRRIKLIGQETGKDDVDENWLVFHQEVFSDNQAPIGRVEIAFSLSEEKEDSAAWGVEPLVASPLIAFFPTVIETRLGFLVQGPFRTTPSRDNIPVDDPWNQKLVIETSILLGDAIRWLRDREMLNTSVLRCLPLDSEKFPENSRFRPLFDSVKQMLQGERLLPAHEGRYLTASEAKLARTQDIRKLFGSFQVEALFGLSGAAWLSGDITHDRAPEIRQYLIHELGIEEVRPEALLLTLTKEFLEAQSDAWIVQFYEYLSGQGRNLHRHLSSVPIVRLSDGSHVVPLENGRPNAFLPTTVVTDFPLVRREVCGTEEIYQFLSSLGIAEPDLVDDVIWNVLPKYQKEEIDVDDTVYDDDIERILMASRIDSTAQKETLHRALRNTNFVMAVDTGDGKKYIQKPSDTYIATDRLRQLFDGVPDVLVVDRDYNCLRGTEIRDLLVSCGASRYLAPEMVKSDLDSCELTKIRREAGLERYAHEHHLEDFTIRGLSSLLEILPSLSFSDATFKVRLMWEALDDLETHNQGAFSGSYKWSYYQESRTERFDASFVRELRQANWIPSKDQSLVTPGLAVFGDLGWKYNPFLLSKIEFKPPIIDQLAREAGIDPAALDLLRSLHITNAAELASRLGIENPSTESTRPASSEPDMAMQPHGVVDELVEDTRGEVVSVSSSDTIDLVVDDDLDTDGGSDELNPSEADYLEDNQTNRNHTQFIDDIQISTDGASDPDSKVQNVTGADDSRERSFISYVGAHAEGDSQDPDYLSQSHRMQIEARAIDLILEIEPRLRPTPDGNPGFDLYETDDDGNPCRWIEVKSMTGTLDDRPVGLSDTQFNFALAKGEAYWLYIVEEIADRSKARVLRIQNPAGNARTFTFDRGWREVALTDPPD